jgi:hypothetical protein
LRDKAARVPVNGGGARRRSPAISLGERRIAEKVSSGSCTSTVTMSL